MRRGYQVWMCVGLFVLGAPGIGYAQGDADDVGDATTPAVEDRTGDVPATAGAAAEGGEDVTVGEGAGTAPDASTPVEQDGEPAALPNPAGDVVNAGPMLGPGGRELRTDYPGTEEALRQRMETDRIRGVASGEVSSKEVYDLRVKELETRIDDLKDQVFRSKSRIVLLKETLLGNKLAGSKALIAHKDELGKGFKLKRMTYLLDGNAIRNERDKNGSLSEKKNFNVLDGPLGPGTHNLIVQLEYEGSSAIWGGGLTAKLERACKFSVEEGMVTVVEVVAFKDGNITNRSDQSSKLRCDISQTPIVEEK